MPNKSIKDLFNIQSRYLRSAHLERDFEDPSALNGYIVTPQAKSNLERLMSGLQPSSSQRAWRITGDYGSGKSSFAILLAHILTKKKKSLPLELRELFDLQKLGLPAPSHW